MNKQRAKLLLNSLAVILVIGGAFLLLNRNNIKADSYLGVFEGEKEFNMVIDSKKFRFTIKSYIKNGLNRNYVVKTSLFKIKQVELLGLENDFNLCDKPTLKLKDKEIVCLVGDVGVHSQAISFISQDLSIMKIDDNGNAKYSLTTDVPSYQILDYNNDGYDDLILDNRDYDKNPLVDIIRRYYLGANNSLIFDKEERVAVQ